MSLLASVMAHIFRAVAPPSGAWTPAEITTALWLDAADSATITEVSGAVSEWADKSGDALHVSQGTAGARPALSAASLNGLDTLSFDGGDRLTRFTASNLGRNVNSLLFVAVRKFSSVPAFTSIVSALTVSPTTDFRASLEGGRTSNKAVSAGRRLDADSIQTVASAADAATAFQIHVGSFDYANSDLYQYINGSLDGSTTSFQTAGATEDTASARLSVGANAADTAAGFFTGDIAEVLVVHNDVTIATRQRIEGYLAHKWGLAGDLPVGHPYKNAAPTTAWTPADVTTALWLDAADATTITESGGAVSAIADKSGNARNATQATGANQPALVSADQNGLDVLNFNGTSDRMQTAAFTALTQPNTVYLVAQMPADLAGTQIVIDGLDTTNRHAFLRASNDTYIAFAGADPGDIAAVDLDGQWAVISMVFNGASSEWFADGGSRQTGDFGAQSLTGLTLGSRGSAATDFHLGDIGEVLVVEGADSVATRQRIEGYLAHKWGLTGKLPYDHPYKSVAPALNDAPAWTPYNIATEWWMDSADASTITTVSGAVSQWNDKSGNGFHLLQATPADRPLLVAAAENGLDVVRFDGTTDKMATAGNFSITGNAAFSTFMAVRRGATGTIRWGWGANGVREGSCGSGASWIYLGGTNYNASVNPAAGEPAIVSYVKSPGAINTTSQLYLNGAANDGTGHATSTPNIIARPLVMGQLAEFDGGIRMDADVLETIVVASAVDTALRQKIEGYLAWKWGLQASLPSGHPYELAAPTITS